ncbi:MAG: hypothetical protein IRD7MM_05675 [Candidatus Midichloria mitochondrii]|nr:hypothetical protein [Candidatus Midichloria mitochondrii]MDJ1287832.1 hypothetical protein [Candidatus Midichloria mitochondrii]MDJ1298666.1 hypothetical protein [Candidatus Midichloria mitochondrii]MDJ1312872.1 hypothetical protein [Candidatus Midichloria mitochondrii]MDJ1583419.1 hypothetical protein [Candidatus Midichloria mitochondrii]
MLGPNPPGASKEEYFELIYDNPNDSKRAVLLPDDESIAFQEGKKADLKVRHCSSSEKKR